MKGRFSRAVQLREELPWVENKGDIHISVLAVSTLLFSFIFSIEKKIIGS
jgi:hypothetical protein